MHVVTVVFTIHAAHYREFMRAMVGNAHTSLRDEPGCRQFDVCESPAAPDQVFLYEVYDSEADFQAHLAAPHFLEFNALTAPWVADKGFRSIGEPGLDGESRVYRENGRFGSDPPVMNERC